MKRFVTNGVLIVLLFCSQKICGQSGFNFIVSEDTLTSNVPMNEISPRAFRHFENAYGHVDVTDWHKYALGYLVRFFSGDSSRYYVYITQRGVVSRTLIYYSPGHLPEELKPFMNAEGPGCNLLYVSELLSTDKPLYELCIEENSKIRIIEMRRDGEVQTMYEYTR